MKKLNLIMICIFLFFIANIAIDIITQSNVIQAKTYIQSKSSPIIFPVDDYKNSCWTNRNNQNLITQREVYLTFDDGPSRNNTKEILDILEDNGARASFFVIGSLAEQSSDLLKRMNDSGMAILPHCFNHNYDIYKSEKVYFEDLNKCINAISKITGRNVPPYTRMPGGSDNSFASYSQLNNIKKSLRRQNLIYVDWNVCSEDANEDLVDAEIIKNNIIKQCVNCKIAVVLMHDAAGKTSTVNALKEVILFLKENKFVFKTFNDVTETELKEMIKLGIVNR